MKIKKLSKLTVLLLVAAMVISGCASGQSETDTSGTTGSTTGTEVNQSEPLDVSIFSQADDVSSNEMYENAVMNYWADKFNLVVEWQLPPQGSETEQLNMMFGTGDYTDVIDLSFNTENLQTLFEDGVIYDLASYIDEYMPNYKAVLEANPDVKSIIYDEDSIYTLAVIEEEPKQWGGLVYRKDILNIMTNDNVEFPSGNDSPQTVEDWDYMLPLLKAYFDAAGMEEQAALIIPSSGYFSTGELVAGFGIGGAQYVEDGVVKYGIAEDRFFNYLTKMKEWYSKGYVYADFASRTQDLFYLPNTSLTYGGAAGIWYGLSAQLGDAMSLPEYELFMEVEAISAPVNTADGLEEALGVYLDAGRARQNTGWAISTACDEEKLIRLLEAFDYFYTEDGSITRTMGLSASQGAADVQNYIDKGIHNGTRLDGTKEWTEEMDNLAETGVNFFAMNRLPGVVVRYETRKVDLTDGVDLAKISDEIWTAYGNDNVYPLAVSFKPEETSEINRIDNSIMDYAHPMIVKFIMGEEELTADSFAAYQQQLESLGLSEMLEIRQAAYDRYIDKFFQE